MSKKNTAKKASKKRVKVHAEVVAPPVEAPATPPVEETAATTSETPQAEAPASGAAAPKKRGKKAKAAGEVKTADKDGKMSGLDAAAKVITDAGAPLNVKEMMDRILANDLWQSNGKTPHATLYSAIIREIAQKGAESRFKKAERGKFTVVS